MNELVRIDVSFEYSPTVYVYQKNNKWFWKFRLPNGKWFYGRAPGDNEAVARKNAGKKERELSKGYFTQRELDKLDTHLTIIEAVDQFIEHLIAEGRSPRYYKCERKRLQAVAKTFKEDFGIVYVNKLKAKDAFRFRTNLLLKVKDNQIKRVSAFGILNSVKRVFKWLKRYSRISFNPWVEVEGIHVPKKEKSRDVFVPRDIVNRLMTANYEHRYEFPTKVFAYGLFRTGARKEELLYLEINDVNWETGEWEIKPKKCPNRHGMVWKPKYGKSRTTIIPKDLLDMMAPLVERALNHKVIGYTPGNEGQMEPVEAKFVFNMLDRKLSKEGNKVYRRVDSIRGAWGALFIAAGLAEIKETSSASTGKYEDGIKKRYDVSVPYTRHDMRRGFNVEAKNAGMSLDDRSLILGHSKEVNENSYCGKPDFKADKISEIINNRMVDKRKRLKIVG